MDSSTPHTLGRVRFGAIIKEINLYCTPEATVGDYVLVHAGLAITVLDQDEAKAVLDTFAKWDAT